MKYFTGNINLILFISRRPNFMSSPPPPPSGCGFSFYQHSSLCPEVARALNGVMLIAEQKKRLEESTKVCLIFQKNIQLICIKPWHLPGTRGHIKRSAKRWMWKWGGLPAPKLLCKILILKDVYYYMKWNNVEVKMGPDPTQSILLTRSKYEANLSLIWVLLTWSEEIFFIQRGKNWKFGIFRGNFSNPYPNQRWLTQSDPRYKKLTQPRSKNFDMVTSVTIDQISNLGSLLWLSCL